MTTRQKALEDTRFVQQIPKREPDGLAHWVKHQPQVTPMGMTLSPAAPIHPIFVPYPKRDIGQLQRAYGNRYFAQMAKQAGQGKGSPVVQPKLTVTPPNDLYEQEADRIASQAMRDVSGASMFGQSTQNASHGSRRITPINAPEGLTVTREDESAIEAARGAGQPLQKSTRLNMENTMGMDFSQVRIHIGSEANALNESMGARAFTSGDDIFFAQGEYAPETAKGQELLAHELTHIVQQGGNPQTQTHSILQRLLVDGKELTPEQISKETGRTGKQLKLIRTEADYKYVISFPKEQRALLSAKDVKAHAKSPEFNKGLSVFTSSYAEVDPVFAEESRRLSEIVPMHEVDIEMEIDRQLDPMSDYFDYIQANRRKKPKRKDPLKVFSGFFDVAEQKDEESKRKSEEERRSKRSPEEILQEDPPTTLTQYITEKGTWHGGVKSDLAAFNYQNGISVHIHFLSNTYKVLKAHYSVYGNKNINLFSALNGDAKTINSITGWEGGVLKKCRTLLPRDPGPNK